MLGILIADDESIVAFDIKRTLRSFGFDKIIVARNGSEAVEKTRTGNPDLIIMDIMMGHDMNGIDAARVINNQGKKKPIIFVTASTDEKTLSEAQETNPIEIIRKPFSEYQLKDA
ncbi:MAG TPA: response regulator, partial [Ignavibacteriaceae bacterium]|nr:response regulator [Ignavibacteriaceae bacterium]